MIRKKCQYCGSTFYAKINSAMYCSKSCKTLACRAKRRQEEDEYLRQQVNAQQVSELHEWFRKMKEDRERYIHQVEERRLEAENRQKSDNNLTQNDPDSSANKLGLKKYTRKKLNPTLKIGLNGLWIAAGLGLISYLAISSQTSGKPENEITRSDHASG